MSLYGQITTPYWLAAGWTMFHFLWIGALLGMLAALVRTLLRRCSPNVRYAGALCCLAALAITPLALFKYFAQSLASQPSSLAQTALLPPAAVPPATSTLDRFSTPQSLDDAGAMQRAVMKPSAPTERPLSERAIQIVGSTIDYLPWLWLFGSPVTLIVLVTGLTGVERLRRQCELLSEHDLPAGFRRLSKALGISRRVAIGVSERVVAPMLLGILRPLILLPPAILGEWSPEQVEMVLLHELAHVRRHDNLVNFLQRVIESLLFFHPAVWKVSRWVRLEREHCCDAVVLRHCGRAQFYAETLASLALPGITPRHALASLANHQLVDRIRHIMNLEDRSMRVSYRLTGLVAVLAVSAGAVVVAWAQQPLTSANKQTDRAAGATAVDPLVAEKNGQARLLGIDLGGNVQVVGSAPAGQRFVVERVEPQGDHLVRHAVTVYVDAAAEKKPWSAAQAVGAPDTSSAGDFPTAWAAREPDSPDECLTLTYKDPVDAVALLVYETFNPGAISQVRFYNAAGKELKATNCNPAPVAGMAKRILVLPVPGLPDKVSRVELQINSAAVSGWNEIDAVGLVDAAGSTQWASSADASSTFADAVAGFNQTKTVEREIYSRYFANNGQPPANTQPAGSAQSETDQQRALLEKVQAELHALIQKQQASQTEQHRQIEALNEEIEKAFEARERASQRYTELSKTYGQQHPMRRTVESDKKKYTELYESLLRKKGYLRNRSADADRSTDKTDAGGDRMQRLEDEVQSLKKVLEDLKQSLQQQPGGTTGAGAPGANAYWFDALSGRRGWTTSDGVILLAPPAAAGEGSTAAPPSGTPGGASSGGSAGPNGTGVGAPGPTSGGAPGSTAAPTESNGPTSNP